MLAQAHQVFCKVECQILTGPPGCQHELSKLKLEGRFVPPIKIKKGFNFHKLIVTERWDRNSPHCMEHAKGLPDEHVMWMTENCVGPLEQHARSVARELHRGWWRYSDMATQNNLHALLKVLVTGNMEQDPQTYAANYAFLPMVLPDFIMTSQMAPALPDASSR